MLPVYPSICFIISVTLQCDILKLKEYIRKKECYSKQTSGTSVVVVVHAVLSGTGNIVAVTYIR